MFDLSPEVESFARGLNLKANQIAEGFEEGGDAAAKHVLSIKVKQIGATYARPIRRNKNGSPAWKRTGDWLREQSISKPNNLEWIIGSKGNSERYEGRLANLPNGPDGVNRTNKASQKTAFLVKDQVLAIIQQAIANKA